MSFSSPLRPLHAQASPLTPRSPNIQTSKPRMSHPKPFSSDPLSPPATPQQLSGLPAGDSDQKTAGSIFNFADVQPRERQTDPRIPQRRLQSHNPLVRSNEQRQDQRRQKFLASVREKREESRLDGRLDQAERRRFFEEQRQWEAANAQEAPDMADYADEEYEELYGSQMPTAAHVWSSQRLGQDQYMLAQQSHPENEQCLSSTWDSGPYIDVMKRQDMEAEAEAVARAEQQEMEALIAMHEQKQTSSPVYGSEDEDFDEAMVEAVDTVFEPEHDMDLS